MAEIIGLSASLGTLAEIANNGVRLAHNLYEAPAEIEADQVSSPKNLAITLSS